MAKKKFENKMDYRYNQKLFHYANKRMLKIVKRQVRYKVLASFLNKR